MAGEQFLNYALQNAYAPTQVPQAWSAFPYLQQGIQLGNEFQAAQTADLNQQLLQSRVSLLPADRRYDLALRQAQIDRLRTQNLLAPLDAKFDVAKRQAQIDDLADRATDRKAKRDAANRPYPGLSSFYDGTLATPATGGDGPNSTPLPQADAPDATSAPTPAAPLMVTPEQNQLLQPRQFTAPAVTLGDDDPSAPDVASAVPYPRPGGDGMYAFGGDLGNLSVEPVTGAERPSVTAPPTIVAKATGYHPVNPGDADYKMEGGKLDALGKPINTLDAYRRGDAPDVTVAVDRSSALFGRAGYSPDLQAPVRFTDTGSAFRGKGASRVDVARDTAAGANSDENNGNLSFVVSNGAPVNRSDVLVAGAAAQRAADGYADGPVPAAGEQQVAPASSPQAFRVPTTRDEANAMVNSFNAAVARASANPAYQTTAGRAMLAKEEAADRRNLYQVLQRFEKNEASLKRPAAAGGNAAAAKYQQTNDDLQALAGQGNTLVPTDYTVGGVKGKIVTPDQVREDQRQGLMQEVQAQVPIKTFGDILKVNTGFDPRSASLDPKTGKWTPNPEFTSDPAKTYLTVNGKDGGASVHAIPTALYQNFLERYNQLYTPGSAAPAAPAPVLSVPSAPMLAMPQTALVAPIAPTLPLTMGRSTDRVLGPRQAMLLPQTPSVVPVGATPPAPVSKEEQFNAAASRLGDTVGVPQEDAVRDIITKRAVVQQAAKQGDEMLDALGQGQAAADTLPAAITGRQNSLDPLIARQREDLQRALAAAQNEPSPALRVDAERRLTDAYARLQKLTGMRALYSDPENYTMNPAGSAFALRPDLQLNPLLTGVSNPTSGSTFTRN